MQFRKGALWSDAASSLWVTDSVCWSSKEIQGQTLPAAVLIDRVVLCEGRDAEQRLHHSALGGAAAVLNDGHWLGDGRFIGRRLWDLSLDLRRIWCWEKTRAFYEEKPVNPPTRSGQEGITYSVRLWASPPEAWASAGGTRPSLCPPPAPCNRTKLMESSGRCQLSSSWSVVFTDDAWGWVWLMHNTGIASRALKPSGASWRCRSWTGNHDLNLGEVCRFPRKLRASLNLCDEQLTSPLDRESSASEKSSSTAWG